MTTLDGRSPHGSGIPIGDTAEAVVSPWGGVVAQPEALGAWPRGREPGAAVSRRDAALRRPGYERVKRALDVLVVCATSPLWWPVLALLCVVVRVDSRGGMIYRQQRLGRDGRVFTLLKLRSMHDGAEDSLTEHLSNCQVSTAEWERSAKLRRDPRLTRVGGWLRRSSLDELPQLINVLRGEMALVGPRPLPLVEVPRYGRSIDRYTLTRPGLTGLWQVSGRNELEYQRRIELDRWYVRSRGLLLDTAILLRTVGAVVGRRGAY